MMNKKCEYATGVGDRCERLVYDEHYCIFHANEGNKADFYNHFQEEFKNQKKEDIYDFSGFQFPPDQCVFWHKKIDKEINFDNACFWGDVKFNSSIFLEKASFNETTFKGKATFRNVKFIKAVTFHETKFSEDANFTKAIFEKEADFPSAEFDKCAIFSEARFTGEASFQNSRFRDEVNFDEVRFDGRVTFWKTEFNAPGKIKMENTYFYYVNGLFEILKKNKKERGMGFFSEIKEFRNFQFRKNAKTQLLSDKIKIILSTFCEAVYPIEARQIKDDKYIMKFKELHPIWYKIWWLFADCGRSLLRWTFGSIFFAVLFAVVYFCLGEDSFFLSKLNFGFFPMLYYSVVTFTTLGFGDIIPKTMVAALWAMGEVIIGYIMLGGLISIFANKLARRS